MNISMIRLRLISEDESLCLVCVIDSKVYGLFTNGIKSIDDITPHKDEVCDLNGLVMEEVFTVFPGNIMLPTKVYKSVFDDDTLGTINLRPRLSCILKLKPNQMDEKSTFLNRNFNVKVKDYPFVNIL